MRFASSLARLGALFFLLGSFACSSTIDGEGDGKTPPGFDVAVGAEVTLTFKQGICDRPPSSAQTPGEGCLPDRPQTLGNVVLGSGSSFTLIDSKLERGEIVVRLRANAVGDSQLVLEHTSFFGEPKRDTFVLRAREITDVEEDVSCQFPEAPTRRYPVPPDSNIMVKLTAMADATPLLSGALELVVDPGGLSLLDAAGSDGRRVRMPTRPGTYTWKVLGSRSRPITFDVYDPSTVGIDLAATDAGFTVRPSVNGVPTCRYDGAARVAVDVVDGPCRILVGDFEVEGTLPVSLQQGGATLELAGAGSCTIAGSMKNGSADRVTLVAAKSLPPIEPKRGDAIGPTQLEIGGTLAPRGQCSRVSSVGNGNCEAINAAGYVLPDGDCFSDWEWKLEHHDGSGSAKDRIDNAAVGVGLLSELRLSIEFSILTIGVASYSPNNLGFGPSPPPGLELSRLGCEGSKFESLGLRATTPGTHALGLTADNAVGPRVYDVPARVVERVSYIDEAPTSNTSVTTTSWFVGSEIVVAPTYTDGSGAPLRGVAPLHVTGTDVAAEATIRNGRLFTGTRANAITLASTAAPQTQVLQVVDASTIGGVDGLAPKPFGLGEQCVEPFPTSNGQPIRGTPPERARVAFSTDSCAIGGGPAWHTAAQAKKLCLVSDGAGATDVRVSWGPSAAATGTWRCTVP
jgi:hypothetical protein